ncbi:MAG: cytochrome c3 family protein [Thermodesulfobacteriota bacterium]
MLSHRRLFYLVVLAVFILPGHAAAETACFNCHKKEKFANTVVHQPLRNGQCNGCHNPHVAHFKGLLHREGADLCYECHQREKETFSQGTVHPPVRSGQCLSCHEPHASSRQGLLRDQLTETCYGCHEKLPKKFKYTHAPYGEGKCFSCHRPHQSEFNQLLKDEPDKVCLSCHPAGTIAARHPNYPAAVTNCLSCHSPHGSDRKGLVRNVLHAPFAKGCNDCHGGGKEENGTAVCLSCHAAVADKMNQIHSHLTGSARNTCTRCHSPHAADDRKMLLGGEGQVCRNCHADSMAYYDAKLYRHKNAGACTECHDVHGSNELAMLRGDGNTVCTRCHEDQGKFTHPVGEKVRDPRSGQMVHCVSCHTPMGSDFKYHLVFSGAKDLCIQCHAKY